MKNMKKHIMIFAITLTAGVIGSGKPDIMVKAHFGMSPTEYGKDYQKQ